MRFSRPVDGLDKEFPEVEIDEIDKKSHDQIAEDLEHFISQFRAHNRQEDFWHRWSQVREMLFHLNERVNYWENRRTQFLQIGIGLLAGSLAGILTVADRLPVTSIFKDGTLEAAGAFLTISAAAYTFVLIVCFCYAIGCLMLLLIWNYQNNPDYPFTKACRIWVWHYRHAETTPIDTDFRKYTRETFLKQVQLFSENLVAYKRRLLRSDTAELLDQDLSQVYVLLINEKFKIKMVSQLRDCLTVTTRYALYAALLYLVLFSIARIAILL
jgi:hypothetical protein